MKLQFDRFDREYKWNVINRYNKIKEKKKEVVDVKSSVVYDDYFKIVAGNSANIRFMLMSNMKKVYVKEDVNITTKCGSVQIKEIGQRMDGDDRIIEMRSVKVDTYKVQLYVNGEQMQKEVTIEVVAGPLYKLNVVEYQQKLKIDSNNTIKLNGTDKYDNRVMLQLTDKTGDQIIEVQNQNHHGIQNQLNPVKQSDPYLLVLWTINS